MGSFSTYTNGQGLRKPHVALLASVFLLSSFTQGQGDSLLIGLSASNASDALADVSGGLTRSARLLDKLDLLSPPGFTIFVSLATSFSSSWPM